jgi:hypothetical protein
VEIDSRSIEIFSFLMSDESSVSPQLELDDASHPLYRGKVLLYKCALILMAAATEAATDPRIRPMLEGFEALIFGPQSPESEIKLDAIRAAMRDLGILLDAESRGIQFSWAVEWLGDVGVSESNPVTLALFSTWWMNLYTMLIKTIRDSAPLGS